MSDVCKLKLLHFLGNHTVKIIFYSPYKPRTLAANKRNLSGYRGQGRGFVGRLSGGSQDCPGVGDPRETRAQGLPNPSSPGAQSARSRGAVTAPWPGLFPDSKFLTHFGWMLSTARVVGGEGQDAGLAAPGPHSAAGRFPNAARVFHTLTHAC